jgi:hypothetical protein
LLPRDRRRLPRDVDHAEATGSDGALLKLYTAEPSPGLSHVSPKTRRRLRFLIVLTLHSVHAMSDQNLIRIDYEGNFAIITLNNPTKFNSLTQSLFSRLASLLREADANKDVYVTLLIGEGPFFSA